MPTRTHPSGTVQKTGFQWGEGRTGSIERDATLSAATIVYNFCAEHGICVLCKRKWAMEHRRYCAKCVMITRNAQQKRRDAKREEKQC